MKHLKYFTLLIFSCFFFACGIGGSGPSLPETTSVGAGTFGCNVNGALFLPHGDLASTTRFANPYARYFEPDGSFRLTVENDELRNRIFLNPAEPVLEEGVYKLSPHSVYYDNSLGQCTKYLIDTATNHFIDIHYLNTDEDIYSGTFEATFINECLDVVRITEGRFDVKYTL